MSVTLTAHEKKVSQIFSDEYEFNIPSYQRPYAWTTQQAGDLLDDLLSFMQTQSCAIADMSPYFLGSIVLIKSEALPHADVVDGQQRLTTMTLLLSALRALLPDERAAEITNFIYQAGSIISGTKERFRLMLRARDREFFQEYIQRPAGFLKLVENTEVLPDSRRKLRENAQLFQERLASLPGDDLTRLAQFVATRCFLVAVSTPDLDSAYRIFSVMNSRGLDLTATDILKAEIIGQIPEGERDAYTQRWEAIEEDLGRDAFVDLFGHIRMIHRKAKPQGTLLREFQEHVSKGQDPRRLIGEIIAPLAVTYEELTDAAYSSTGDADTVNRHLRWLNRLEFSDWLPPALAFASVNRGDAELMGRFFADLERLAYGMLITRWGVNDRIDRFSRLTKEIEAGADLFSNYSALQLSEHEQAAVVRVLDGPVYESLSARARSSLLLRLDDLLSGGGAVYEYPVISVEHVLPQNPASVSKWLTWFPDVFERQAWTHRLGNLALLTRKKNSSASNYELERKKSAYFTNGGISPFPLTTQVLQHEEWTPAIVEARQHYLLSLFTKHWRLVP